MKPQDIFLLVGCEESQAITIAFRELGVNAFSCDLKPCSGGHPEWHIQDDVLEAIKAGFIMLQDGKIRLDRIHIPKWHAAIFHPDCTYLTCSAEWAYKDGPYHQKVKAGTKVGKERIEAREYAIQFVKKLWDSEIENISIENPIGALSSKFMKPSQIIQPYQFGDDASKATCLWNKGFKNLALDPVDYFPPRIVNGRKRWGNQTDSGQNKLSPGDKRAELRSKTYPGIAKAIAVQWTSHLLNPQHKQEQQLTLSI